MLRFWKLDIIREEKKLLVMKCGKKVCKKKVFFNLLLNFYAVWLVGIMLH